MDNTLGYFQSGKLEGIMTMLQALSDREGYRKEVTKEYVTRKLTELGLVDFIDSILTECF